MDIGNVLSRAWQIIWKHKILWIFGILAGCGSSSGGSGSGNVSYQASEGDLPPGMQNFFDQFSRMTDAQWILIIGIILLVVLVLVVLAVFLGTIGRIGLIRGTVQAEEGADTLAFGDLFQGSFPYFWRVFLLNLLVGLAFAAVVVVIALFAVFGGILTFGILAVCLIPVFCLLVPVGWLVGLVVEVATIAIVREDLGIMAGLERGWNVFRENLGTMLVMGLILMVGVAFIGGMIIAAPVFFIIMPAVFGAIAESGAALGTGLLITGLCLLFYLPVAIVLNGILRGYVEVAWTLTFMRLTGAAGAAASEEALELPEPEA